jgi:heme oxygenase
MTFFPLKSSQELFSLTKELFSLSFKTEEPSSDDAKMSEAISYEMTQYTSSDEVKGNPSTPMLGATASSLDAAYIEGKISKEIEEGRDFHASLVVKTSQIHKEAVRNKFLQSLLKGAFCPTQFTKYLMNLNVIHFFLEEAQKNIPQDHPSSSFVFKELWKSEALEKDISFWKVHAHGSSLESDCIAPSTKAYVEHLTKLSQTYPELTIAHLWVFYGTLLSGGQMIGRSIKKEYTEMLSDRHVKANSDNEGALFFYFPFDIASFKKDNWYPALNGVYEAIKDEEKIMFADLVKEEANIAFRAVLDFVNEIESGAC